MPERILIFVFAAFTAMVLAPDAQAGSVATLDHVRLAATLEAPLQPGKTVWVAIRQQMDPGWHTYWRNPGEAGVATSIAWTLPPGISAGDIRWPAPEQFSDETVTNYGYEKDATLLVPLTAAATAEPGMAHLTVNLLACEHMCIPEQATLDLDLGKASGDAAMFKAARRAIPRPFAGKAHFSVDAHSARVVLDLPQAHGLAADAVSVFPVAQSLMADGGVAHVSVDGSRVTWIMPAQAGAKAPSTFAGVFMIAGQGAWAFTALPGITAAPLDAAQENTSLMAALALAFLGGLILNLMPCVLPVLSMKALALARTGSDSAEAKREGLFYLAGVMATFAIMAAMLLALKASGAALGWGFQLQSPLIVLSLALLMAAIGMNLFGVFELPLGFSGAGDHLAQSGGAKGAFFTGALAVVVASPCTAPFMGAALGFALTQPVLAAASVFLALGLGFAAPFTVVSFSPAFVRLLPKPGHWMNAFKQALAFPMFATAIWLLWVLGRQSGTDAVVVGLAVSLGIALLVWLCRVTPGLWSWVVGIAGAAAITISSVLALAAPASPSQAMWRPWSEQALASARQAGRPVLVDFSAAWCVTCLVNERVALNDAAVVKRLKEGRVVTLKGDWTNPDPAITAALHQFGRDGVPLYVLYAPNGGTDVLPQILTPKTVITALAKLETTAMASPN
ncbi:protein-disulfide reductase DsbD family protein [Rhizomicrobium electricum]|nr:protein-disulfide reductase DsbD domain-containing protein [Rhizomicrobium electricum]NIJ50658.1 thiol:disulfide interchange protein DsbD [Rhizomicrobium electricum]